MALIEAAADESPGGRRRFLSSMGVAEDLIHYCVALLLLVIAAVVLFQTVADFVTATHPFSVRVTAAINGVLFVIIVMEILTTVTGHFRRSGFQLKPFLIIGIISAVRHILTVGAQVSLGAEKTAEAFGRSQMELGVNAAVVVALVVGLVAVRRTEAAAGPIDGVGA